MPANKGPRMMINAAALTAGTIITSVLGLVFWAIASRLYDAADVGLANAQLSAATLLAAISAINLGGLLLRYLPLAGHYTRWIIVRSYTGVTVLSLAVAVAFVLFGFGDIFLPDAFAIFVFILAVPLLAIFQEQDPALIGMHAAPVVTLENGLFAIAKIVFLAVFASATVSSAIFAAWILPAFLTVVAITVFMFVRLIPRQMQAEESIPLPPRKILWPQIGKLYSSALSAQLLSLAIPLIITARLGAAQNGYLTIPWLIGVAFVSLITIVNTSFGQDVRSGHPVTVKSLKRLCLMLLVVAGAGGSICAAAAPLIMRIVAPDFADEGTGVLRLIGLSAPFIAIWLTSAKFLWLENRIGWSAAGNFAVSIIAIIVTFGLADHLGINAAGLGNLIGFGVVALVSAIPLYLRIRHVLQGRPDVWAGPDDTPPVFTFKQPT